MNGFTVRLAACAMAACAVALFPACSEDNEGPKGNPREDIPLSRSEEELVEANNEFAYKFMSAVCDAEKDSPNFVVSPLSLSMTMSMIANGAAGETQAQILDMLGFDREDIEGLNSLNRKLLETLPGLDNQSKVCLAQSVWVSKATSPDLNQNFVSLVTENYSSPVTVLDRLDNREAMDRINSWVSDKTDGMIGKLLSRPLDVDKMAIMNALYFKGGWKGKFDKSKTQREKFANADGTLTEVDMMRAAHLSLDNFADESYIAAAFPYGNCAFSMIIILPDRDASVDECIKSLNHADLTKLAQGKLYTADLEVKLPKFAQNYNIDLEPVLKGLGVTDAFSEKADFSGMLNHGSSQLSLLAQGSTIVVDEGGTVASSVTIGGMGPTDPGPIETEEFFVDRPFAFIIAERSTGLPLFMGRVTKL